MWLQPLGVVGTGVDLLDIGVTDFEVVVTDHGTFLLASTGKNGGITSYQVMPDGTLAVWDEKPFGSNVSFAHGNMLTVTQIHGTTVAFFGANGSELVGYVVNANGTLGGVYRLDWENAEQAIANGTPQLMRSWLLHSDTTPPLMPAGPWSQNTMGAEMVVNGSGSFLITFGAEENQISSFFRDHQSGTIELVGTMGAQEGLGISAPTALAVVEAWGDSWVIVASAGSSSISVMMLDPQGALIPTDHVIDTGSTRFAAVQALAVATSGDHVFVVAGGGDHGLTLFALLPNGQLVWLDTLPDGPGTALYNVSAISATVVGGTLVIAAGSQMNAGLTQVAVPLSGFGAVLQATATQAQVLTGTAGHDILIAASHGDTLVGGAGNDILVAGPGETWMTGGAGVNTFVMQFGSGTTHITDFTPGVDRLDLSDWLMLRNLGQLSVTSTATGAIISYFNETIHITSASGAPLSVQNLFPNGLLGPDRILILNDTPTPTPPQPVPEPEPQPIPDPDQLVAGTEGNDTLTGGTGNDTINAFDGDDLIFATGGNNEIAAGSGDDTVHGGPGNDTIWGGPGDDLIIAGEGNNLIGGGPGNDTVWGGPGNDTIWGGPGNDVLHAGSGDNLLGAGTGDDTVYTGPGNDTVWGGGGNDLIDASAGGDNLIWGGAGSDVIIGGAGNDTISPGPGFDIVTGGGGADTFIFWPNTNWNTITDFSTDDGDILQLSRWLWTGAHGALSPQEVIDTFAQINANGDVVLNFGPQNAVIVLQGVDDPDALADHIAIY